MSDHINRRHLLQCAAGFTLPFAGARNANAQSSPLLVGGLPRVYEINRNFRNEGLDKQHNPEFTMLEVYEAFGDCTTVMDLTEAIIRDAAMFVARQSEYTALYPDVDISSMKLPFGDVLIDSVDWRRE